MPWRSVSQFVVLVAILAASTDSAAAELFQQEVFVSGQEGYHTFRIPALITTQEGTLLAFCEGRKTSGSDAGDIDLVVKRSEDAGATWSDLSIVYEEGGDAKITIGNPCPVIDSATGIIWMPFCRDNDRVFMTHSTDDGQNWSEPVEITSDVKLPGWSWYATGPGVGIQIASGPHKGRMVIPCDHRDETGGGWKHSHVFYSDDAGQSWQLGGRADKHTDECQVVQLSDDRLMLNMRNYWQRDGKEPEKGGKRAIAYSSDGGESWSDLEFDETLIEPVCQASLLRIPGDGDAEGATLLFSNPASTSTRHRLTVRQSTDDGATWPVKRMLNENPSAYSCLTVLDDGRFGCLYETGEKKAYETIVFARFDDAWLSGD